MPSFDLQNYVDVQERINRFWSEYQNGRIDTNLMSPPDDFSQCRYVARIYKDAVDAFPSATGWAFEVAGSSRANTTSHEENCETSAIGRALANMGYAKNRDERPSRQEMEKVVRSQPNATAQISPLPTTEVASDVVSSGHRAVTPQQRSALMKLTAEAFPGQDYVAEIGSMSFDEASSMIAELQGRKRQGVGS